MSEDLVRLPVVDGEGNSRNHNYTQITKLTRAELCEDMYYQEEGFYDNTYLIPHSREFFYDQRKEFTHFRNYLRPIVDATVRPVFASPIERKVEGDIAAEMLWEAFVADCVGNGTHMDKAMKHFTTIAQVSGACVVCMDNGLPSTDDVNVQIAYREFPFLNAYRPGDVDGWMQTDQGELTQITIRIATRVIDEKERVVKRRYDSAQVVDFYVDNDKEVVINSITHGLGKVPVAILSVGEKKNLRDLWGHPPFYPIAKVVFSLYNLVSQNEDISRSSRFPTLYAQGIDANSLVVGTKAFMGIPDGVSIAPGYVSPDTSIMSDGRAEVKELVQTIYQLAEQSGVTGVVDQQSGVAKEWDFRAHETILTDVSTTCAEFEYNLSKIFGAYIGLALEVTAIYPQKFAPSNVDDQISQIEKVLLLQLPPMAAATLKRKAYDLLMRMDDSPEAEAARQSFGETAIDEGMGAETDQD